MKKDKLFYAALALGLVALCSSLVTYNRKTSKSENQKIRLEESSEYALEEVEELDQLEDNSKSQSVFGADESKKNTKKDKTPESDLSGATADSKEKGGAGQAGSEESGKSKESAGDENATESLNLDYKGEQSLIWPVEGNIILPFSMDTTVYFETMEQYQVNPGMLIESKEGTVVVAAEDGKVIDVKDDDRFGKMVSVDLGGGFVVTYGQMKNLTVKKGDTVVKGCQLGQVAKPTKYFEKEGQHLYMSMEKDKEPMDPISVLK